MAEISDNELEAATGGTDGFVMQSHMRNTTDPCCGHFEYADIRMQEVEKTVGAAFEKTCGMCVHLKLSDNLFGHACELGY